MKVYLLFSLLLGLIMPAAFSQPPSRKIFSGEVPVYQSKPGHKQAVLFMEYASSTISTPEAWDGRNKQVYEVDLVFSAYPKKKEEWITDYQSLLNSRINELIKLEPTLGSDTSVRWNLILQTQCMNEAQAKRLFHGAVLRFRNIHSLHSNQDEQPVLRENKPGDLTAEQNLVEGIVYGVSPIEDSTILHTLGRNNWGKMLIVTDWTGSMYQYGAQVVLWHRLHFDENKIKLFTFFNDGNRKIDRQKRVGNTGGIFNCPPDNFEHLLKTMNTVMKLGNGGDIPENNLEAVIKGLRMAKDVDEIVMIADNHAGVRDMSLLSQIKRPIRIILCGLRCGTPIHPHYLEIARQTRGSIHTIEQDIETLFILKENQRMEINGVLYKIRKGKLVKILST